MAPSAPYWGCKRLGGSSFSTLRSRMKDSGRRWAPLAAGAGATVGSGAAFDGSGTIRSLEFLCSLRLTGRAFSASTAAEASLAKNVSSRLRSDPLLDGARKLRLPILFSWLPRLAVLPCLLCPARDPGRDGRSVRLEVRDRGRGTAVPAFWIIVALSVVDSRLIGVGVGGCSRPGQRWGEAIDEAVEAEPGGREAASFFFALASTHKSSSAKVWRSVAGRVRGTERGAVRGTEGEMPPRMGVNMCVAGGAEV